MTVLNRELFSGIGVASVHAVRPRFRFVPRSGIETCDGKLFRSFARSFVLGWWPRGWRFSWNSRTLFRIRCASDDHVISFPQVADRVFSETFFSKKPHLLDLWTNYPMHPLQEQEPNGDRAWIPTFPVLQV